MADPADLTDIAGVRQFMQKRASDTTQDADLEVLITQASMAIQRHCNREFAPATATATRSFEYEPVGSGFEILDATPYEIRSISTVKLDADLGAGVTLETSQYRLWPYPSRDGTFLGVRLTNLPEPILPPGYPSLPALPFLTRRIDITGAWGMTSVPPEVKHYANVTVESWIHLRRDAGVGLGDVSETPQMRPDDLPPAVRWGLQRRWMRPTPSA
ncbi:MAG TPA: hypothetical protein VIC06_14610 [Solirubrobacteraceae bacterium]